jgi:deoxyadenosine/deoxycytidine kinase
MSGGPSVPIVLLTGPPGAGKSTVGRLVAEAFERSVHIEADVVRESIVGGFVTPSADMFHDEGIRQFALQREIVIQWALRKAEAGYVPVIDDAPIPPDGHFEHQYAPLLTLGCTRPVILRAEGEVVRERIRARGGRFDEMLVDAVEPTLGWLDDLDPELWFTVDSTDLTIEESAAMIVAHLRGGEGLRD